MEKIITQYTVIDEYSSYRALGANSEQSIYSFEDALCKVITHLYVGDPIECAQAKTALVHQLKRPGSRKGAQSILPMVSWALIQPCWS